MDGSSQSKPLWRAIWDFPLVAMIVALAVLAAGVFGVAQGGALLLAGVEDAQRNVIITFSVVIVSLLLCKYVISHLGETKRDDLQWSDAIPGFLKGTVGSALLMSTIVAIVYLLGGYQVLGWGGMTSWVFLLVVTGFQAGFVEEIIFRGVLFRYLEEFGGSWFALSLTSAFFGFAHAGNANATWFSSLAIAIEAGIMLGGAYMLTRSLWLPIGIHFGWNVTQGLVWDVPVSGNDVDGLVESQAAGHELLSGGQFGLEASLVALILATLVGFWLTREAIRKGELMRPSWVRRRLAREAIAAETDA